MSTHPTRKADLPTRASTRPEATVSALMEANPSDAFPRVVDISLVVTVLAFALGLAMIAASLTSVDHLAGHLLPTGYASLSQKAVAGPARPIGSALAQPQPRPTAEAWAQQPEFRSLDTGNQPSVSPLFPQNGVTLWDRIRVSSQRDRRAFLLGTAIQLHAPAAAATPGPRFAPLPCCPR